MNKRLLIIPLVVLVAALVAVSVNRSSKLKERSDYNVYYTAGRHFIQGQPLYGETENVRNFYYPPFAAFLFQGMTIVPLKLSANIFFLLNALVLLPLAIWLIFGILKNLGYDGRKVRVPVILAVVASLKFFWNNLTMFQMNFVIFTMILGGVWYMTRRKPVHAVVLFTLATFIKVYPVFFILYALAVKRTRAVFVAAALTGLFCMAAPAVERGFRQDVEDHVSYYHTFLRDFSEGHVITMGTNHTFRAFVLKAFVPASRDRDVYPADYPGIFRISGLVLLVLFGMMVLAVWRQVRLRGEHISLEAVAALLLFTHLFSGITWTAHFVTSMFYYLPLFLIDFRRLKMPVRIFHLVLIGLVFFLAIEGSDTTGRGVYTFIRHYDLFTITALLLFGYYVGRAGGDKSTKFLKSAKER